jgi:hypothetical protein
LFDVNLAFGGTLLLINGFFLLLMLIEDFPHGFGPMLDELAFYPFFGSTLENVLNEAGEALFD